ncbi:MAG: ABC transporter ATP-binding protein [Clostridia bacterium]|nr:ABC transporter ATP-binding protein [Clostridia bacterium]
MLRTEGLTVTFGEKTVISGFSHVFPEGGTTVILGGSGSGKTTLINALAGSLEPAAGKVINDNKTVSRVFQEDRLIPSYTSLKNLTCVGISEQKAERYLEKTEIADAAGKRPGELSGGMKRRLALARALAFDAELYLFDEPLSGLDPDTAIRMAALIRAELEGKTAVIVTHNEEAARIMATAGTVRLEPPQ